MTPITIDFETYYDKEYSLSKMSMEAYIRDPRFEVIMLGIRMPDGTKGVITGTHAEIKYKLDTIPWHEHAVLAHNTLFDAAIMSWVFDIRPALWLDTLSMANAIHHGKANSLAALAERYHLKEKGTYVHNMLGRRRESLTRSEFKQYAGYCVDDLDICHSLFELMSQGYYSTDELDFRDKFPRREFELIDMIIRMFTEPVLRLDKARLERHLEGVQKRKEELLEAAGIDKEDLMSNPKFATVLESFGVVPPKKISATTGKTTFAFAKTDPGMKALLEHPDERVQAIVSARMGVKSTLEETRTQRFIDIAERGESFPVPLKYYAARTGRLGGCLVADSEVWVYDPVQDAALSKRIVDVMPDDLVWDGEEFVEHSGVSFSGFDEVISYDGVTGTSDHRVFTDAGERTLAEAASSGARITTPRGFSADDVEAARRRSRR